MARSTLPGDLRSGGPRSAVSAAARPPESADCGTTSQVESALGQERSLWSHLSVRIVTLAFRSPGKEAALRCFLFMVATGLRAAASVRRSSGRERQQGAEP